MTHRFPVIAAFVLGALVLGLAVAPPARPASAADRLPDTEAGRRAQRYLEAFNSGRDEAMRAFLEANVSKTELARRPIEERLGVFHQMRDERGTLTVARLLDSRDNQLRVLARDARGGTLDMTFLFEAAPPHTLLGLRVMDQGPGDPGTEGPPTPMPDDQAVRVWSAYLDSLAAVDAFSGAVLVTRGDEELFRAAYGLASRAKRIPNRTDTRFNLGSINKIFTQLAIAQLVEQGKVKLDDPIERYLPEYPKAVASKVTVRQLLEHRGGIGDIFGEPYARADRSRLRSVSDWIPLFRDKPPAFEPGTRQEYSNGGYVLLGAIVEKASGEDYYDYVRRHVYEPLGMKHTDHYAEDSQPDNLAAGYTRDPAARAARDPAGLADNRTTRPMRGSPAGGGYSTLDDLLAFARAVRAGKLVRPETLNDFPDLGPGPGGEVGLGIAGGAPGINALLEMLGPYTIIVLTNLDPPAAVSAGAKLRRMLPGPRGAQEVALPGPGHEPAHATEEKDRAGGPGGDGAGGRVVRGGVGPGPERSEIPPAGVEVEMLRDGPLPALRVRVNGLGPFRFGIDTGAGGAARIDSALAARLGLRVVGQVRGGDPSGRGSRVMDVVHVDSIEIAGARFGGFDAAVRDYNERRMGREAIDGVLGFAMFERCLLTLDYPAGRVRISRGELPPPNGADVLAFTSRRGIPSIELKVDSVTVEADLDAGSMGGFSLPLALAARLPLASPLRVVGRARTVGNEFEIQAADLAGSVKLGGFEFPRATVEFQPVFPMANVGSRVLRDFRVTFDQKNQRLQLRRRG
jgi:D-alanyl-D-alanine carboxypeptidase